MFGTFQWGLDVDRFGGELELILVDGFGIDDRALTVDQTWIGRILKELDVVLYVLL